MENQCKKLEYIYNENETILTIESENYLFEAFIENSRDYRGCKECCFLTGSTDSCKGIKCTWLNREDGREGIFKKINTNI